MGEAFFDAEHFFDGFFNNREYAMNCIRTVGEAGADTICLCDTNGGRLPAEIEEAVRAALGAVKCRIAIHCHNDSEVAVANTIAAVRVGATQVQGTINGVGERCGNANLISIIPWQLRRLQLGYLAMCLPAKLKELHEVSMLVYELANITPASRQAFVGRYAFAHKGGLHVSAILRNTSTYEHIDPALVGNNRHVVLIGALRQVQHHVQKQESLARKRRSEQ